MPRIYAEGQPRRPRRRVASMRPGHFAPDICRIAPSPSGRDSCFNEAGAFCPGYIFFRLSYDFSQVLASMRPGHFAPDICLRPRASSAMRPMASMRPGHFAPDIYHRRRRELPYGRGASMRPGHFAPDISRAAPPPAPPPHGFNEAGAFCPGYIHAPPPRKAGEVALQ